MSKQPRTLASQTPTLVGTTVMLQGWVEHIRDHGKVYFLDLRDRSGLVQVVASKIKGLSIEAVVEIEGQVAARPESMVNPNLATGTVEIQASLVRVVNPAQAIPFPINTNGLEIKEEVRLKHRYLDLRRPRMQQNLRIKAKASQFIRTWLSERDFVEIETPMLTKSTPEGARDFLVPSRLQPGKFYALPQSPQQYKQLLMVAGFERYFQFARCFRDEDPRADRAYGEFTQLDMEMSFVTQEDILVLIETMFTQMVETLFPHKYITKKPWPRLSHHEAMAKYGTDKPDLRENPNDPNELAFSWTLDFPLFTSQSDDDFFHGSGAAAFAPSHHMFTAPHPDDVELLDSDPLKVRGLQHDLVLNGYEVGGGSIRIHDAKIQSKIFELIGFSAEQQAQFEHMLTAFSYGVPPHGGIAPGLDRLLMVLLCEPNLREVIAFPTSASGATAVMAAPSVVDPAQLKELGLVQPVVSQGDGLSQRLLSKLSSLGISPVETDDATPVKAMVVETGKERLLCVLPTTHKLDYKKIKQAAAVKDAALASKDTVEAMTQVPITAVPPVGSLLELQTYLDTSLETSKYLEMQTGIEGRTLVISTKDFLRLEQPILAELLK